MASGSRTQNVQSTVASASVGVANVARNGRRMKTDPAWEHGVTIDDDSRRVRCNYCKTDFTGGAYRLKLHLAGTSKDVRSCDSVPDDVKKTMEDIVDGLRIRKKKSIGNECDVAEAEVAANSNGKRKNVREIARKDISKRGFTTLTLIGYFVMFLCVCVREIIILAFGRIYASCYDLSSACRAYLRSRV
jgi:hypothetical protein